jgi:hypothetical protein
MELWAIFVVLSCIINCAAWWYTVRTQRRIRDINRQTMEIVNRGRR